MSQKSPITHRLKYEWLVSIALGLLIGLTVLVFKQALQPRQSSLANASFAQALAPVLPYTVSIYTSQTVSINRSALQQDEFFAQYLPNNQSDNLYKKTNLGSGIILDTQGHIVTNAHVVKGAQQIIVVAHNGEQAEVISTLIDNDTDIAVLQTGLRISQPLPTSDSSQLKVGDLAFTIGNPFGIGQSVSMGIISATSRAQPQLTNLTDFIQTDAAINPGNSGGALVNANGEVIGMNTAIFSSSGGSQGIGFAIPFEHVQMVAQQLLTSGMISRGYIGIDVNEVRLTESWQETQTSALVVTAIAPNSPAAIAGIQVGDILLSVDNEPLISRAQAARLTAQLLPEQQSQLRLIRDNKAIEVTVTIGYRNN
ncbi:S1C family serine protease [Reinekea thalattae]|uniref:Trypsin-like serine protease n=1 Tax=Reinekea thalattae TaxID=2593301 RepID=A0A5C8Z5I2_9GAMM|nr:trypsin-like peptidase domain-containing protein [Reinekea thalattae]TXR52180.1 trypsin-like serine protease [Reinekea thalattae]